jgi:hypothetical protein
MFMYCKEEAFLARCEGQETKKQSGTLSRVIFIQILTICSRAT